MPHLPRSTHPTIDDQFVRGTTHRRIPSPATHLDGWRAGGLRALTHRLAPSRVSLRVWVQGCGSCSVGWVKCVPVYASTRTHAARNPSSMHADTMGCARTGLDKQTAIRRAPPVAPPPPLAAGPIENHSPPARKRLPPRRIHDAYAECDRPRGRLRRAPKISSVNSAPAAHRTQTAQLVAGVGWVARNLDAPEGI